jgi:hypothetical protein
LDPGNNTEYSTISVDVAWWQDIQYWVRWMMCHLTSGLPLIVTFIVCGEQIWWPGSYSFAKLRLASASCIIERDITLCTTFEDWARTIAKFVVCRFHTTSMLLTFFLLPQYLSQYYDADDTFVMYGSYHTLVLSSASCVIHRHVCHNQSSWLWETAHSLLPAISDNAFCLCWRSYTGGSAVLYHRIRNPHLP